MTENVPIIIHVVETQTINGRRVIPRDYNIISYNTLGVHSWGAGKHFRSGDGVGGSVILASL